jgi:DNA-binding NtrC family response regulator
MLIRVGISIHEAELAERVYNAVRAGRGPGRAGAARERLDSVVVEHFDEDHLLDSLRADPRDLVIGLASGRDSGFGHSPDLGGASRERASEPESVRELVDALAALPERTGLILLHPDDDPHAHAALLSAGCVAVLWTGLSNEGLAEALASLFERRRDDVIARVHTTRPAAPEPLVAASPAMRSVLETARRIAVADTPVLLLGETGVGKERIAQLLHAWSPRSRGPFVVVNCAAIPAELFESELFGHERGAFTGAIRTRRGQFELANRGTLFLDEIAETPLAQQAKLLRALQERRIRPVGGDRELAVDVRVIAATNRDMRREIEAGRFRRDLYYRLGVVEIEIPPLRERPADIRELVRRHAEMFATRLGRATPYPTAAAMAMLEQHAWPGNVRELVNVIERSVLLASGSELDIADLPPELRAELRMQHPQATESPAAEAGEPVPEHGTGSIESDGSALVSLPDAWLEQPWKLVREQLLLAGERAYLIGLLRASGGRIGTSARRAGMSERALFEKMKRHGLRKEDYRG